MEKANSKPRVDTEQTPQLGRGTLGTLQVIPQSCPAQSEGTGRPAYSHLISLWLRTSLGTWGCPHSVAQMERLWSYCHLCEEKLAAGTESALGSDVCTNDKQYGGVPRGSTVAMENH